MKRISSKTLHIIRKTTTIDYFCTMLFPRVSCEDRGVCWLKRLPRNATRKNEVIFVYHVVSCGDRGILVASSSPRGEWTSGGATRKKTVEEDARMGRRLCLKTETKAKKTQHNHTSTDNRTTTKKPHEQSKKGGGTTFTHVAEHGTDNAGRTQDQELLHAQHLIKNNNLSTVPEPGC